MGSDRTSEATPIKLKRFRYLAKVHCRIAKPMHLKWPCSPEYLFVDMTAGPGSTVHGDGSPLIFQQVARELKLPHKAFLIERDSESASRLSSLLTDDPNMSVVHGDNKDHLPLCLEWLKGKPLHYGMIYSDANGEIDQLPFDVLAEVSPMRLLQYVDILIHLSPTIIKRVRSSPCCPFHDDLMTLMSGIQKNHWYAWDPVGAFQWTFLFGTNWKDFPRLVYKDGNEAMRFVSVDSREGRELFARLNYTETERKEDRDQSGVDQIARSAPAVSGIVSNRIGGSPSNLRVYEGGRVRPVATSSHMEQRSC